MRRLLLICGLLALGTAFLCLGIETYFYFSGRVDLLLLCLVAVVPGFLTATLAIRSGISEPTPIRWPILAMASFACLVLLALQVSAVSSALGPFFEHAQPGQYASADTLASPTGWIWTIVASAFGTLQLVAATTLNAPAIGLLGGIVALPAAVVLCAGGIVATGVLPR